MSIRLRAAARPVHGGRAETLAYTEFPPEHWRRIKTNNGIERIDRETRRRTRVVFRQEDLSKKSIGN